MPNDQSKSLAYAELYDSGATRHMSPYKELFINYRSIDPRPITAADKRIFYAVGAGDLKIQVPNAGKFTTVILHDALHAPEMGLTVVSINRITKAGHKVLFDGNACKIKNSKGTIIGEIPVGDNGLYKVEHASMADGAVTETVKLSKLHKRLGHISIDTIRSLIKHNVIQGIQLVDDLNEFACDSCEYGKATRKVIRKEWVAPLASSFGDEIHTDVWGPSPINSLGGRSYYVTFTDDTHNTQGFRLYARRMKPSVPIKILQHGRRPNTTSKSNGCAQTEVANIQAQHSRSSCALRGLNGA